MSIWTSIRHAIIGDAATGGEGHTQLFDMENRLGNMPGAGTLNWRTDASDLMRLIGIEPTEGNRAALASELGYGGSAGDAQARDVWLHGRILRQLEEEGGTF